MTTPFEAKLYVQGPGNWMRHPDGSQAAILLPDSDHANEELALRTAKTNEPFCHHYAVLQCESRHLRLPFADAWTTVDLSGLWARVDATGPGVKAFDPGDLASLPDLKQAIESRGHMFTPWKGDTQRARAGLILHQGAVSPHEDYAGDWEFETGGGNVMEGTYSSVHCVDLGTVESLEVRLRPFGTEEDRVLTLAPPPEGENGEPGLLSLWFRSNCELTKPLEGAQVELSAGSVDYDFNLNLFNQQGPATIQENFSHMILGDTGGETARCMGARAEDDPLAPYPDPWG